MKLSILCTNTDHPVVPHLKQWQKDRQAEGHEVQLVYDKKDLNTAGILFLVSCSQLIDQTIRDYYQSTLVLHASDLPNGRGWSPHIWAILDGATTITVSLLEAAEPVDSGSIWLKTEFDLEGHELLPEINQKLFKAELDLMSKAIDCFDEIKPEEQQGSPGQYLTQRTPKDSELDPKKTIEEQFNLLRTVDNQHYPAFFNLHGKRYKLTITKDDERDDFNDH